MTGRRTETETDQDQRPPPPFNREAEEAVVGAIFIDSTVRERLAEVRPEDFHIRRCGMVWRVAGDMVAGGEPVDILTVAERLDRDGLLDEVGGPAWLNELSRVVPTSLHADSYAKIVLSDSLKRDAIRISAETFLASRNEKMEGGEVLARAAAQFDQARRRLPSAEREMWTPAELCDLELPSTPWLLDGYLVDGGVASLVGDAGVGKTFATLDLSLAVYTGGRAWGRQALQGRVVYFGLDSPRHTFQRRLRALCAGRGIAPPREGFIVDLSPLNVGNEANVREVARVGEGARLIVLDALYTVIPGLDENSASDMGRVFSSLRWVASRTGACILVVRHTNKNPLADDANRGRGSSAIRAAVDSELLMTARGAGPSVVRFLTQTKSREGPAVPAQTFEIVAGDDSLVLRFAEAEGTAVTGELAEVACGRLVEILRSSGAPQSRRALADAVRRDGLRVGDRTLDAAFRLLKHVPGVRASKVGREVHYVSA